SLAARGRSRRPGRARADDGEHQPRDCPSSRRRHRHHPLGDRAARAMTTDDTRRNVAASPPHPDEKAAMAHVTVTISGRQYRMACEDGQEGHLTQLAADLDRRVEQLRGSFGEIGDNRLVVMAALMTGDELSEAMQRVRKLEDELSGLRD